MMYLSNDCCWHLEVIEIVWMNEERSLKLNSKVDFCAVLGFLCLNNA